MDFLLHRQVSKKLVDVLVNAVEIVLLNFFLIKANCHVVEDVNENFNFIYYFIGKSVRLCNVLAKALHYFIIKVF